MDNVLTRARRSLVEPVSSRLTPSTVVTIAGLMAAVIGGYLAGTGNARLALLLAAGLAGLVVLLTAPALLVAAGGFLLLTPATAVGPIPINELGGLLIILGTLVIPRASFKLPKGLWTTAALFLAWTLIVVLLYGLDGTSGKRLLHLVLWLGLIAALALPRAPLRALAYGIAAGIAASFPASLVVPSFEDRWGGFFGDPNTFAAALVILTPLAVSQLVDRWAQLALWTATALLALASLSRTGIAALAAALTVVVLWPRIKAWVLAAPAAAALIVGLAPERLATSLGFEERTGSDDLRNRIAEAAGIRIAESPISGHGLGQAFVDLAKYDLGDEGDVFFLHNSGAGLVVELGYVGLLLFAVLFVGAVLFVLRAADPRYVIAGLGAGVVMATQLGEVLLDLPMAVALGMAWSLTPVLAPRGLPKFRRSDATGPHVPTGPPGPTGATAAASDPASDASAVPPAGARR